MDPKRLAKMMMAQSVYYWTVETDYNEEGESGVVLDLDAAIEKACERVHAAVGNLLPAWGLEPRAGRQFTKKEMEYYSALTDATYAYIHDEKPEEAKKLRDVLKKEIHGE